MLSRLDKKTQPPVSAPEVDEKTEKINKEADIQKKRLTLIILLSGTIGLSLIFSIYRNFKTNPPKFEIPTFKSTPSGGSIVPSSELKSFLSNNKNITALYIKVTNPDYEYFYGHQPPAPPSVESAKSRLTTSADSPLPEALVYKEVITPTEITVAITVHARNFLLYINASDTNLIKPDLLKITSLAYWSVFGN